jgi:hypothetical protein
MLSTLEAPSPRKMNVDVHADPFASFAFKRVASAMQKIIVPWGLAQVAYILCTGTY